MYLSKIKKNKLKHPVILLQGVPGSGKSTLASQIPDALYFALENPGIAIDNMISKDDVGDYKSFIDILCQIRDDKDFKYKAIIIDSMTALNSLAENYVLDTNLKKGNIKSTSISDNDNPLLNFGKGDKILSKIFQDFMDLINEIRDIQDVEIVLLGHETTRNIMFGLEDDTPITMQVADVNQKSFNKILASIDIVAQLSKDYQLKSFGQDYRGTQKKIVKNETVVLRLNNNRVLGKVRDEYLNKSVIYDGIIHLDNQEYTLDCYPLLNKETMYKDFERLLAPEFRICKDDEKDEVKTMEKKDEEKQNVEENAEVKSKSVADIKQQILDELK